MALNVNRGNKTHMNQRESKLRFYTSLELVKYYHQMTDIKKRWHEYTEELYKKDLHDPDNHDGVITHLKPDILECKVKWP